MNDSSGNQEPDSQVRELLEKGTDWIEPLTGLPAPVRRNFTKAIGRLMSVAVEYPANWLENKIQESKAESDARIKIIAETTKQIVKNLDVDPEYAHLASDKFAKRIVREQTNKDKISLLAYQELAKPPYKTSVSIDTEVNQLPEIDEDWLNLFESEAANISNEHAQKLFAKILAGEIHQPSSFSKKTLRLLSQLDQGIAEIFTRACSMSISLRINGKIQDARVVGMGLIGSNSLRAYGLGFDQCIALQEFGLVITDLNSYSDYQWMQIFDNTIGACMQHQNKLWGLSKPTGSTRNEMRIAGLKFTSFGNELLEVVDIHPVPEYTSALTTWLENLSGGKLTEIQIV